LTLLFSSAIFNPYFRLFKRRDSGEALEPRTNFSGKPGIENPRHGMNYSGKDRHIHASFPVNYD
jgi:hypothetical protein